VHAKQASSGASSPPFPLQRCPTPTIDRPRQLSQLPQPPQSPPRPAACRSEADQQYYDGTIHDYSQDNDCYNIQFEQHPGTTAALQFHQASAAPPAQRRRPPCLGLGDWVHSGPVSTMQHAARHLPAPPPMEHAAGSRQR
jgi:hypothetical protein